MIHILPNGGTLFTPSPTSKNTPTRTECIGWSRAVSRRNTDFLLSVDSDQLQGFGYALTLTIRECPESPNDWQRARLKLVHRLRRMGMIRMHWLTEWQRRQVPHLHAAVWFSSEFTPSQIISHWMAAASPFGCATDAQFVAPIAGAPGWFEYLAKHAARSITNYQRSPANVPPQWQGKTGRMWGKLGSWPVSDIKAVEVPASVEFQYRRLLMRYQVGKARRQGDVRREVYFRRYLSRAPKETSARVATPRLWVTEDDQWSLLRCAFDSHAGTCSDSERAARHQFDAA